MTKMQTFYQNAQLRDAAAGIGRMVNNLKIGIITFAAAERIYARLLC